MVARKPWRARLAAGGAGLAINAGLLALLTLERRAPPMIDPPTVVIALERRDSRPERRRAAPARRPGLSASAPLRPETPASSVEPLVLPAASAGSDLSQTVEPRWRVGGGEYLDPETARRARRAWEAAEDRRYTRACLGQSDEHMTEEEKSACWDAWGGGAPLSGPDGSRPGRRYPGAPTGSRSPGPG